MSFKSLGLSDELHRYLVAHNGSPDALVDELMAETRARLPVDASMQIAPEQAPFLTFLTRLVNARHAVEVGTFTGLSAISIARGLAPGGRLICLDISEEYTSVARRYWQRAGLADVIDLRIGPAAQSLTELNPQPHVDFAFIDADKTGYPTYWNELVPRMRPGGVIVVDNVLRRGDVVEVSRNPTAPGVDPDTAAIVAFNDMVLADDRVETVMIPLADGLTLARKLP
jgi:caffeoyl-CoA O-methyltransferase